MLSSVEGSTVKNAPQHRLSQIAGIPLKSDILNTK